jgi:hypothetical protein
MKAQFFATMAAMLALSNAAPTSGVSDVTEGVIFTRSAQKSVNDCADSSFVNQSSGGSPLISDCQKIASNIAGGGTWTIGCGGGASGQRTYATYGTCAVGAHCDFSTSDAAYIGNQDTIDIINSSIQKFSWQGKVGAKGSMGCQSINNRDHSLGVTWGIYHT